MTPLLTAPLFAELRRACHDGSLTWRCSLDLGQTVTDVILRPDHWEARGGTFPYLEHAKDRTIYHWGGSDFMPVARFSGSLVKLVPTPWGPPTFEIDGIKMLRSESVSPFLDAQEKVALIEPRGKALLDCCGGLGYFASSALVQNASRIVSFEKNADVLWLRSLNPWSPAADARLQVTHGDVVRHIETLRSGEFDAVLHDPPRVSIAGELYSGRFYEQLARVMKPHGRLFHYTGAPQRASHGRDLAKEVIRRLNKCGFRAEKALDGVFAVRRQRPS